MEKKYDFSKYMNVETTVEEPQEAAVPQDEPKDDRPQSTEEPTEEIKEEVRLIQIPQEAYKKYFTYKEWKEFAEAIRCTQRAIDIYWNEGQTMED